MLKNKSKKTIIAKKTEVRRSAIGKALGLMFTLPAAVDDKALVFEFSREKRIGLHMLFVFYPIDVIFLDDKKRAVEITTLQPFCLSYAPKNKAKYIIECKVGSVKRAKVEIMDIIQFPDQNI